MNLNKLVQSSKKRNLNQPVHIYNKEKKLRDTVKSAVNKRENYEDIFKSLDYDFKK